MHLSAGSKAERSAGKTFTRLNRFSVILKRRLKCFGEYTLYHKSETSPEALMLKAHCCRLHLLAGTGLLRAASERSRLTVTLDFDAKFIYLALVPSIFTAQYFRTNDKGCS